MLERERDRAAERQVETWSVANTMTEEVDELFLTAISGGLCSGKLPTQNKNSLAIIPFPCYNKIKLKQRRFLCNPLI